MNDDVEAPAPGPSPAPDRAFEVYPLFLAALATCARHLPGFAALYLPVAIVATAFLYLGAPTLVDPTPMRGTTFEIPPNEWLALAGSVLFTFSFGLWSSAALYRAADAAFDGRPVPGFARAYGEAVERVPALLGAQLLYLFGVLVGTLFCLVPGMWLAILLLPGPPRAATRDVGPIEALQDARALVTGRWWRTWIFLALTAALMYALFIPYVTLSMALPHGDTVARVVRAAGNVVEIGRAHV